MVDGFAGDTGAFTLTVTCPSPPPTTRTEILCGVPTFGTTVGQADSYHGYGPDVSFIFNASVTGDYTFSTCIGTYYLSYIDVIDLATAISVGCTSLCPFTLKLAAVSCQCLLHD